MNRIVTTAVLAATLAVGAAIGAEEKQPTRVYAPFHKLEFEPEQQLKIAAVQAEYRDKIAALEDEMHDKVLSMLTDQQRAEFAQQEEDARKKRAEYAKKYRERKKAEEVDADKKSGSEAKK